MAVAPLDHPERGHPWNRPPSPPAKPLGRHNPNRIEDPMPDRPDATHTAPPRDPAHHLGRQTPTSDHADPATQALSVLAAIMTEHAK